MELRTVRRGLVALAVAATLGLAGAYPAAAAELGWFERSVSWLAGLWAADEPAARAQSDDGGLFSLWTSTSTADKGMGLDPNGEGTQTLDPTGTGQ
jgi:hypothetical protein